MTKEEKYWYIFEDTRFEGRPRVKWITDCLLGDIRTFLDGIENYTDNKEKFAGKLPRGGGNLSVPILINTALEFVAALYAGKTKYMKNVSYNATDNVRSFIKDFFTTEYKQIPLLLWDGVRNGLVHSFYPKSFSYQKSSQSSEGRVQFQFYVEDRNFPSHFKNDNDTIRISINVFELYRVLEKAIEDYLDKLRHDEALQDKFIRAWSSIEDYKDKADSNQSDEIKELLDCLGSNSAVPLLEDLEKTLSMDVLRIYSLKIRRL